MPLVQQATAIIDGFVGGAPGLTVPYGQATVGGNTLAAIVSWASSFANWGASDAFTLPAGWTQIAFTPSGTGLRIELWCKTSSPVVSSVAISASIAAATNNCDLCAWIGEFPAVEAAAVENHGSNTGAFRAAPTVSALAGDASSGNTVLAGFVAELAGSSDTFTAGTGFTKLTEIKPSNVIQAMQEEEYAVSGAAGVQTAAGIWSTGHAWGGVLATFAPLGGGGTPGRKRHPTHPTHGRTGA